MPESTKCANLPDVKGFMSFFALFCCYQFLCEKLIIVAFKAKIMIQLNVNILQFPDDYVSDFEASGGEYRSWKLPHSLCHEIMFLQRFCPPFILQIVGPILFLPLPISLDVYATDSLHLSN